MRARYLLVLVIASAAHSDAPDGGQGGDFLRFGASARTLGLGGAFTGLADDVTSLYTNPAGLDALSLPEASFMHVFLYEGTFYDFVGAAYPTKRFGTIGLGGVLLRSGDFEGRDSMNRPTGTFAETRTAFLISYANTWELLSYGATVKAVSQSVSNYAGSGFGVDMGVLWRPASYFNGGLSVQNVMSPKVTLGSSGDTYPRVFSFGGTVFLGDRRIAATLDLLKIERQSIDVCMGAEWWVLPTVAIRAGFDGRYDTPTLGASLRYRNAQVDYALAPHPVLGVSNRVSISWRFGDKLRLVPDDRAFSPTIKRTMIEFTVLRHLRTPVDHWELVVENAKGEVVHREEGKKNLPEALIWDGRRDVDNQVADEGRYTATLVVYDRAGIRYETSTGVKFSLEVPEQTVPIEIRLPEGTVQ